MKLNEVVINTFGTIFEENLVSEICNNGILKTVDPEKIILEIRREIKFIPLIVSGEVKVMRRDGKGNGIMLHYLTDTQSSAIAITYALQGVDSDIRLKAESELTYIAIPSNVVNLWLHKYNSWRDYFLELNQLQTASIIGKINNIAFEGLEKRVSGYLKETSETKKSKCIYRTHFDIARDLKVSRESVSRVLKKFEKEQIVSLGRNKITLN